MGIMGKWEIEYIGKVIGDSIISIEANIQRDKYINEPIRFDTIESALSQVDLRFTQRLVNLTSLTSPTFTQK